MDVAIKVAGIHWWYKSRSHAAEMTAGYYNHLKRDGYAPIARMLAKRGVGLSFTCIEMSDDENPDPRHCSPEGALLKAKFLAVVGFTMEVSACKHIHSA